MKIVNQAVRLEAVTQLAHTPEEAILGGASEPALVIEAAGRTCYKSEGKIEPGSAGPFIERIRSRFHESVLEHASATFRIWCDRGVSHELVRHRLASYSQESTRYCNYGKEQFGREIQVIQPPGLKGETLQSWQDAVCVSEVSYFHMLDCGCAPQIARSVLPTCLKTEVVMTANFREWLHFLRLRTAPAAHPQMREVALMIAEVLRSACPEVFGGGA